MKKSRQIQKCSKCDYTSNYKSNLIRHVKVQHEINQIIMKCLKCDFTSRYRGNLMQHEKVKHEINQIIMNTREPKIRKCSKCDFTSKYKDSIISHEKVKHDIIICHICSYKAGFKKCYDKHMNESHLKSATKPKNLKCAVCDMVFQDAKKLWTHKYSSNYGKLKFCFICDFKSCSIVGLMKHVNVQHNYGKKEDWVCSECEWSFTTFNEFERHFQSERGENCRLSLKSKNPSLKEDVKNEQQNKPRGRWIVRLFKISND